MEDFMNKTPKERAESMSNFKSKSLLTAKQATPADINEAIKGMHLTDEDKKEINEAENNVDKMNIINKIKLQKATAAQRAEWEQREKEIKLRQSDKTQSVGTRIDLLQEDGSA